MNRDDQEMVRWYQMILKKAAVNRLMVLFHGAYKPTGTQRTYPNLVTLEGVLGNEQNKVIDWVTPEHTVTIPFTRMLAGPIEFCARRLPECDRRGVCSQYAAPPGDGDALSPTCDVRCLREPTDDGL